MALGFESYLEFQKSGSLEISVFLPTSGAQNLQRFFVSETLWKGTRVSVDQRCAECGATFWAELRSEEILLVSNPAESSDVSGN